MMAAKSSGRRLQDGLRHLAYDNPFYNLSLGGKRMPALSAVPPDLWPGNVERGAAMVAGTFTFTGQAHIPEGEPLEERYWFPKGAGPIWHKGMQQFGWLRDLRAVGGDEARRLARNLVIGWLEWNALWNDLTWTPELLGPRIANWIGAHDFFWASADEGFRYCVLDSLARQTRHLARLGPNQVDGESCLMAAKGLAYGSLCVTDGEACRAQAVNLLARSLPQQVLADGGHGARCPSKHLHVLRTLIDIRLALRAAKAEIPASLGQAIDRMAPVLRSFRHGDGGLALFNGGWEEEPDLVEAVLTQSDGRSRPLRNLPHTKFQRLVGGRSVLLMDVGEPPPPGLDQQAHAGMLSFELSVGRDRIIVNCGADRSGDPDWHAALAGTAAHSTLIIADTNSAVVLDEGGIGRRPTLVACERVDLDDATMVVARHNGYAAPFRFVHRRRLWLSETGLDLRGEDMVEPVREGRAEKRRFAIRFHLHPQVQASLAGPTGPAILELPDGAVWSFTAPGHAVVLADSIYAGTGERPVPSAQIIVAGEVAPSGATVKWALIREDSPAESVSDAEEEADDHPEQA